MMELIEANWWIFVLALAIGIAVAWWIFVANRKTRVITTKPDVLDEGAAPAKRNQALIDAPSAAELPCSVLGSAPRPEPTPQPVPAPPPPPPPAPPPPPPAPEPTAQHEPKPKAPPKPKAAPKPKAKPAPKPKPSPEPKAAPAPEPVAAPAPPPPPAPAPVGPDELTRIKGLGPKLEKLFQELGVTSYAQIAAWTDADIDKIDPQLGVFEGRIRRDAFVEQAGLLASGDIAAFEAKFGAL